MGSAPPSRYVNATSSAVEYLRYTLTQLVRWRLASMPYAVKAVVMYVRGYSPAEIYASVGGLGSKYMVRGYVQRAVPTTTHQAILRQVLTRYDLYELLMKRVKPVMSRRGPTFICKLCSANGYLVMYMDTSSAVHHISSKHGDLVEYYVNHLLELMGLDGRSNT